MSNINLPLKKVTTEISGTVFSLPYYVAREKGYFTDLGLEIEFVKRNYGDQPANIRLIDNHHEVSSFGGVSPFEQGQSSLYRACEWGQVRRTYDSSRGGQVIAKRAAVASQAIIVHPDSPYNIPQDLANVPVGVNFHHGSHYIAIQTLEGFLPPEEIKVLHIDGHAKNKQFNRFVALRDGLVDAVAVMEPWITVAEKLGYKIIAEAHYVGLEIASPDLDVDSFEAINKAIRQAVKDLQADPIPYTKYLIDDVSEEIVKLEPWDFRRNRLRYVDPSPYSEADFQRTYNWMVKWGLIQPNATFQQIVDNRVLVSN
ncbi:ABC transporter substrate-binding protein [Cylindrospermopsis raciborskii UAM/DH-BiRr]|uniref:ABC transporter substrate-binding protein n=1 Tax=Cylindrospermopsis raciborskii TaxID=77022 RepID=UPI00387A0303